MGKTHVTQTQVETQTQVDPIEEGFRKEMQKVIRISTLDDVIKKLYKILFQLNQLRRLRDAGVFGQYYPMVELSIMTEVYKQLRKLLETIPIDWRELQEEGE